MARPKGSRNKKSLDGNIDKSPSSLFAYTFQDLSEGEKANIRFICNQDEFDAFRKFFMIAARDFYRLSAQEQDDGKAHLFSRIGIFIEDSLASIADIASKAEQVEETKDAYDGEFGEENKDTVGNPMDDDIITKS